MRAHDDHINCVAVAKWGRVGIASPQSTTAVATANKAGKPNVSPKGSIQVLDDNTLLVADLYSAKTRANLMENPQVAITVVDAKAYKGWQFKDQAELIDKGQLFDEIAAKYQKLAKAKYVVKGQVEEVINLAPGLG